MLNAGVVIEFYGSIIYTKNINVLSVTFCILTTLSFDFTAVNKLFSLIAPAFLTLLMA